MILWDLLTLQDWKNKWWSKVCKVINEISAGHSSQPEKLVVGITKLCWESVQSKSLKCQQNYVLLACLKMFLSFNINIMVRKRKNIIWLKEIVEVQIFDCQNEKLKLICYSSTCIEIWRGVCWCNAMNGKVVSILGLVVLTNWLSFSVPVTGISLFWICIWQIDSFFLMSIILWSKILTRKPKSIIIMVILVNRIKRGWRLA